MVNMCDEKLAQPMLHHTKVFLLSLNKITSCYSIMSERGSGFFVSVRMSDCRKLKLLNIKSCKLKNKEFYNINLNVMPGVPVCVACATFRSEDKPIRCPRLP